MLKKSVYYLLFAATVGLFSCSRSYKPQSEAEVRIHSISDADMLNPYNKTDAVAQYIVGHMFQSLTNIDPKTLEIVPIVAEGKAQIEKTPDNGMLITYKIRPEAKWDNGTPITAKDIDFSLKVMKNPKVNNQPAKPYYEFISDIKLYDEDPLKFTFICNGVYILAESVSGGFEILPEYFYDPKGLMKNFSIKQLDEDGAKLVDDPKINEFATDFNSEKRAREKDFILGSGPYKLAEWSTGQRIVLEKKKNWWGEKFAANPGFEGNANKLIYQTVNDPTTAQVSLKSGNLDVMPSIPYKDFAELRQSEKFKEKFGLYTPPSFLYYYLGLNTKNPKFSDKKVRQALAHLVDVDKMIKTLCYGMAERAVGPVHLLKKKDHNFNIVPYDYNIEKTKQMLADAGWKDSNGNGTIDKKINGQTIEFTIDFAVNAGNEVRKQAGLIFQEEARKVGISVNVVQQDWSVYISNQKKHNFEMFFGGWAGNPNPEDFKQIFHTESSLNEGSNSVSFGNAQSDALIDSIRVELDNDKRAEMSKRFQKMVYDETAYIFLWVPTERIAISKKFGNVETSIVRPGYEPAAFTMVSTPAAQ